MVLYIYIVILGTVRPSPIHFPSPHLTDALRIVIWFTNLYKYKYIYTYI